MTINCPWRLCRECGKEETEDALFRDAGNICDDCVREYQRAWYRDWYRKNRDRINTRKKERKNRITEQHISVESYAEVIRLVAYSLTNEDIGKKMGTSKDIVKEQLKIIFYVLGITSRIQLVLWALKKGIISLDEIKLPQEGNS